MFSGDTDVPSKCKQSEDLFSTPRYISSQGRAVPMPGRPEPDCTPDGSYAPSQCLGVMCMCVHPTSGLPGVGSQHFIWDDVFDCSVKEWEYSSEFDPAKGMGALGGRIVGGGIVPDSGDSGDGEDDGGDRPMPDGDKSMPDSDKSMPDEGKDSENEEASGDESASQPDTDDVNYMGGPKPYLGDRGGIYFNYYISPFPLRTQNKTLSLIFRIKFSN